MKNKKLLTNILFAAVMLAIAAVLLAVRSHSATGGKLAAQLIYGDNNTTMNLPLEDFYAGAKDADVLLYNSTIEGVVHTTEELVAKCPLLAEFKAVQSGSVWCTTQSFFQQSTALVDFVLDLHRVFTENDPADLQFLRKVE